MDVELDPPGPPEVAAAAAEALAGPAQEPDPWWEAGIRENLGS